MSTENTTHEISSSVELFQDEAETDLDIISEDPSANTCSKIISICCLTSAILFGTLLLLSTNGYTGSEMTLKELSSSNISSTISSNTSSRISSNILTNTLPDISLNIPSDISSNASSNTSSSISSNIPSNIPSDISSKGQIVIGPNYEYNVTYFKQWYGSSIVNSSVAKTNIHNKCGIPNLMMGGPHKMGGYFRNWQSKIKEICKMQGMKHWEKNTPYDSAKDQNFINYNQHPRWNEITNIYSKPRYKPVLLLMSYREPLYTILSAYNYHAMGNEKSWTNIPLNKIKKGFAKINHPFRECFKDVFDDKYLLKDSDTIYKHYVKGYENNYEDEDALQYGLYLEFTRYYNCEYKYQYNVYKNLKQNIGNIRRTLDFMIVRFDWFNHYNYSQGIGYLLDTIMMNKNEDDEIIKLKKKLYDALMEGDLTGNVSTKKQFNKATKIHITKGKYDIALQTKLLLSYHQQVCSKIRQMTEQVDVPWKYVQYC